MPSPKTRSRQWKEKYYDRMVPPEIGLFEGGLPDDATDPMSFVMRVNRKIVVRALVHAKIKPHDLTKAMSAPGAVRMPAELVVFGAWLVRDGMPGARRRPGQAPDTRRLLKVAACAFAALENTYRCTGVELAQTPSITTKDVAEFWEKCFDEERATSDFTANIRSLRHILVDYLGEIKAGTVSFQGQTVKGSPRLKRLAAAIVTRKPARDALTPSTTVLSAPVSTASAASSQSLTSFPRASAPTTVTSTAANAVPKTFEIPLTYSSSSKEAEYRGSVPPPYTNPSLRYSVEPVLATKAGTKVRPDLSGRVEFKPDFRIAGSVSINALIDRIAFVVTTKQMTSNQILQSAITRAGANVHVEDRTKLGKKLDHHACLPVLDIGEPTGRHFALTLQDPTPQTLRTVLKTIEEEAGIDGSVRPFLLELAVDLYPDNALSPSATLLAREQLVGLTQRHVWSAGGVFDVPDNSAPRDTDQRQVYWDGHRSKPRYLFSDARSRWHSDRGLIEEDVRRRLLSEEKPGNELYLDATIYRGHRMGRKRINIQHKVADMRNRSAGTKVILTDEERRARIEVTLTSNAALEQAGLRTLDDLSQCNFRSLRRDFLLFRLPTCEPNAKDTDRTIAQIKTRGIYGVELSQRARYLEKRARNKSKPRNNDRDGRWLVDWPEMNDKVGAALDRLRFDWGRF